VAHRVWTEILPHSAIQPESKTDSQYKNRCCIINIAHSCPVLETNNAFKTCEKDFKRQKETEDKEKFSKHYYARV
jgi:hypothetical protein